MRAPRSWGPEENLTLSEAELDACRPVKGEGNRLRAFCPYHGSDHQRSLSVDTATGHFKCFACGAWGYLESHRKTLAERSTSPAGARLRTPTHVPKPAQAPPMPPAARPELAGIMAGYRDALPGSPGEAYLRSRGISLDVAQLAGVGYAGPGTWAHRNEAGEPLRDWKHGRLVFPHTDPAGGIVNLYGRAVGDDVLKQSKHDHLAGAKGYFNAQALREGSGPVTICEGAFDALALMAAGAPRVVAIFGVNGWRWEWAKDCRELLFALDSDEAGSKGLRELARGASLRGKRVAYLEPEAYGGAKDASAAWQAGTLTLGDWGAFFEPGAVSEHSETFRNIAGDLEQDVEPARAASDATPWSFEAALDASRELLTPQELMTAYEMSYGYLDAGPAGLDALRAGIEAELVGVLDVEPLPPSLAAQCFAWGNAAYMARMRRSDDLPPA